MWCLGTTTACVLVQTTSNDTLSCPICQQKSASTKYINKLEPPQNNVCYRRLTTPADHLLTRFGGLNVTSHQTSGEPSSKQSELSPFASLVFRGGVFRKLSLQNTWPWSRAKNAALESLVVDRKMLAVSRLLMRPRPPPPPPPPGTGVITEEESAEMLREGTFLGIQTNRPCARVHTHTHTHKHTHARASTHTH